MLAYMDGAQEEDEYFRDKQKQHNACGMYIQNRIGCVLVVYSSFGSICKKEKPVWEIKMEEVKKVNLEQGYEIKMEEVEEVKMENRRYDQQF